MYDPQNAQLVLQEAKEALVSRDWGIVLEIAKLTKHIADPRIAASSWCKLRDIAVDDGDRGTLSNVQTCVWRARMSHLQQPHPPEHFVL